MQAYSSWATLEETGRRAVSANAEVFQRLAGKKRALIAAEEIKWGHADAMVKTEFAALEVAGKVLAEDRGRYQRMRSQWEKLTLEAGQLTSRIEKAADALEALGDEVAANAETAARAAPGPDDALQATRSAYDALAASERAHERYHQGAEKLRTDTASFVTQQIRLATLRVESVQLAARKAPLAVDIEARARVLEDRVAKARAERSRLDALAAGREKDTALLREQTRRFDAGQAELAAACAE